MDKIKKYFNQNGGRILLIFLVIYTFVLLGRSVLVNFKLQRQIKDIQGGILSVKDQNQNLENLILYYQTDSFREVEARRKLGLKKPGEKVFIVAVQKFSDFNSDIKTQTESLSSKTPETKQSNLHLWWQYLTQ
jgi:cell division protein FtsB